MGVEIEVNANSAPNWVRFGAGLSLAKFEGGSSKWVPSQNKYKYKEDILDQ